MSKILQQIVKRTNEHPKIPSPKPLADIMERSRREKPSKIPSPRRQKYKSMDIPEIGSAGEFRLVKKKGKNKKKTEKWMRKT